MPVRGEVRDALCMALKGAGGTTRDLAMRAGIGVTSAMYTLDNMVRSGEARVVDLARVPGVKRPVPVYGLALDDDDGVGDGGIDWSLITCWGQWPAVA